MSKLTVLTKRSDFLKAARSARTSSPAFNLQARRRDAGEAEGMRVGYTCSKKVGNAVARNRAKRRLREIARVVLPEYGVEGYDYVLVGRPSVTANYPFEQMIGDLEKALTKVHRA